MASDVVGAFRKTFGDVSDGMHTADDALKATSGRLYMTGRCELLSRTTWSCGRRTLLRPAVWLRVRSLNVRCCSSNRAGVTAGSCPYSALLETSIQSRTSISWLCMAAGRAASIVAATASRTRTLRRTCTKTLARHWHKCASCPLIKWSTATARWVSHPDGSICRAGASPWRIATAAQSLRRQETGDLGLTQTLRKGIQRGTAPSSFMSHHVSFNIISFFSWVSGEEPGRGIMRTRSKIGGSPGPQFAGKSMLDLDLQKRRALQIVVLRTEVQKEEYGSNGQRWASAERISRGSSSGKRSCPRPGPRLLSGIL